MECGVMQYSVVLCSVIEWQCIVMQSIECATV
jgi:hypothetical protein